MYRQMCKFMREAQPSVFTSSVDKGVKRVRDSKGKYAFLLDSMNYYHNQRKPCTTMNCYHNQRKPCTTVRSTATVSLLPEEYVSVKYLYDVLVCGRAPINIAVLQLREVGELHKLERKWWYDKGECGQNIKSCNPWSLSKTLLKPTNVHQEMHNMKERTVMKAGEDPVQTSRLQVQLRLQPISAKPALANPKGAEQELNFLWCQE
ncbi:hypothetical protein C0Q70_05480 [Pomacea canaliculata]|uniref:Uncharacterized protein n=1 Tax=Pomacea canaliculata TaxID=400727 RepID=A0A2T7PLD6_POMCA|nr:hypothetical protein C0Q70_05480 [Pomacea canaliculata]